MTGNAAPLLEGDPRGAAVTPVEISPVHDTATSNGYPVDGATKTVPESVAADTATATADIAALAVATGAEATPTDEECREALAMLAAERALALEILAVKHKQHIGRDTLPAPNVSPQYGVSRLPGSRPYPAGSKIHHQVFFPLIPVKNNQPR